MKEAAGEANMTVITIVLIAIVLGVGTIIVNNLMTSNKKSSACSAAGGTWKNGACFDTSTCTSDGATIDCSSGTALTWDDDEEVYTD